MPWKNREESYPKWYEKNKKRLNKKKQERWKTDEEYRNRLRRQKRKYNLFYKRKVVKALGDECVLCRRRVKLRIHEIHGLKHNRNYHYILNHIGDFTLLCWKCHSGIHWLMKHFGMKWEEIVVRLPLKGNNNG